VGRRRDVSEPFWGIKLPLLVKFRDAATAGKTASAERRPYQGASRIEQAPGSQTGDMERQPMAEKPSSRDPEDYVEYQRALVAKDCSPVPMSDVWLVQMIWAQ